MFRNVFWTFLWIYHHPSSFPVDSDSSVRSELEKKNIHNKDTIETWIRASNLAPFPVCPIKLQFGFMACWPKSRDFGSFHIGCIPPPPAVKRARYPPGKNPRPFGWCGGQYRWVPICIQRTSCVVWYSFVPSVKISGLASLLLVLTPFALYQVSEVLPKFRDINSAYLQNNWKWLIVPLSLVDTSFKCLSRQTDIITSLNRQKKWFVGYVRYLPQATWYQLLSPAGSRADIKLLSCDF